MCGVTDTFQPHCARGPTCAQHRGRQAPSRVRTRRLRRREVGDPPRPCREGGREGGSDSLGPSCVPALQPMSPVCPGGGCARPRGAPGLAGGWAQPTDADGLGPRGFSVEGQVGSGGHGDPLSTEVPHQGGEAGSSRGRVPTRVRSCVHTHCLHTCRGPHLLTCAHVCSRPALCTIPQDECVLWAPPAGGFQCWLDPPLKPTVG